VPGLSSGTFTTTITAPGGVHHHLEHRQTTTLSGTRTVTTAAGVLQTVVLATVTSGLFAGDTVVQTGTSVAADTLLCTLGLRTIASSNQAVVLEITSI
jgi:hypothetical protein